MRDVEEIINFWFGVPDEHGCCPSSATKRWFRKNKRNDAEIAQRFGDLIEPVGEGVLDWSSSPEGRLASIVLLDQFTRNIYRGQPRAHAWDHRARDLCLTGIELGHDRVLGLLQRVFFCFPLGHSEQGEDQELRVALVAEILRVAPPALKPRIESFYRYALKHRSVIRTFGRFPHRNRILGRISTPEESAFLQKPGSRF